jgi:hypothetical protein
MVPVMERAPVTVDTEVLTERTDFADLAHRALLGTAGGALRSDCFPVDWVFRAYHEVAGTRYADLLAYGVAACLTAPEPEVRAQALIFFGAEPAAAGGERLAAVAAANRDLFAGVPDPMQPGGDLEQRLLSVLAVWRGPQR